jgi:hypothetical protein
MEIHMEIWRQIDGHPHHQISNLGNIRSLDCVRIAKGRWGGLIERLHHGRLLKPFQAGKYLGIRLSLGAPNFYMHRLVAVAFVQGDQSLDVNHIDGNKHNNKADNLEWVTKSQNMQHAVKVLGIKFGSKKKVVCAS